MKFENLFYLIVTDDWWITLNDDISTTEHIEGTAAECWDALNKYAACTVTRITPVTNGIEIDLKSPE